MNNNTVILAIGAAIVALILVFFAAKKPEVTAVIETPVIEETAPSQPAPDKDTNTIIREQLGGK